MDDDISRSENNFFWNRFFFEKCGKFSRADFWNRANGLPIYEINQDKAPKTAREPLLAEAQTF